MNMSLSLHGSWCWEMCPKAEPRWFLVTLLCMSFSIIFLHSICYGTSSDGQGGCYLHTGISSERCSSLEGHIWRPTTISSILNYANDLLCREFRCAQVSHSLCLALWWLIIEEHTSSISGNVHSLLVFFQYFLSFPFITFLKFSYLLDIGTARLFFHCVLSFLPLF